MAGLDGWTFPQEFALADGDSERVVALWWNRLDGAGPDGRPFQAPGVSVLHYAGDGRFSYELDILNMAEVIEVIGASGWTPPATFNAPPRDPRPRPHTAGRRRAGVSGCAVGSHGRSRGRHAGTARR